MFKRIFIQLACCWNVEKVRIFQVCRSDKLYLAHKHMIGLRVNQWRFIRCIILFSSLWPGYIVIRNINWITQVWILAMTTEAVVTTVAKAQRCRVISSTASPETASTITTVITVMAVNHIKEVLHFVITIFFQLFNMFCS